MQVLPGHPWHILEAEREKERTITADGVAYNTKLMETKKELVKNSALETFAYTKTILVKPWLAANKNNRDK